MEKNNTVSKSVFWSFLVIVGGLFLITFIFWDKIRDFFTKQFWGQMTQKGYINELLSEIAKDPNSILSIFKSR